MRSIFEKRILTVEEFQEFVQKVDYFISSLISSSELLFARCLNYQIIVLCYIMTTCTKISIRLYFCPQLGGILDAKITFF
jgi:fatty-acid desaturase